MNPTLAKYLSCRNCGLHKYRYKVVLGSGHIPADLLLIGEAPGQSEDTIGMPFVGPAGRLLDVILSTSQKIARIKKMPTMYRTNVLACRPCDGIALPNRAPTDEEMWACEERLVKTIALVSPKAIALIGKTAERVFDYATRPCYCVLHPAFLLRTGGVNSPQFSRTCREFADILWSVRVGQEGKEER